MGGFSVKKKEKMPFKWSAVFAVVFTDSSVASRHALRRKLPNCSYSAIAPNLGKELSYLARWKVNSKLTYWLLL